MAVNVFATLTVPQSGAGAATSTTTMGPQKTITVTGTFVAPVIVEVSNDGATFAPIAIIYPVAGEPSKANVTGIAVSMRVSRPYPDTNQPTVTVSAAEYLDNDYGTFDVPASDGVGAATNTSTHGELHTLTVVGAPWTGTIVIEGSADAGATYDVVGQFSGLIENATHLALALQGVYNRMRVRRYGVKSLAGVATVVPTVAIGSASIDSGGGQSDFEPRQVLFGAADGTIAQDPQFFYESGSDRLYVPVVYGSSGAGGALILGSTSNATKGKIFFSQLTSAYDEVTTRLGIGTTFPTAKIHSYNNLITAAEANILGEAIWQNAGVTFDGWVFDARDSASANDSRLLKLQTSTVTRFAVTRDGLTSVVTPTLTYQANVLDLSSTWHNASGAFKGIYGNFSVNTAASGANLIELRSVAAFPAAIGAANVAALFTVDALNGRANFGLPATNNPPYTAAGYVSIWPYIPGFGGGAIRGAYGRDDWRWSVDANAWGAAGQGGGVELLENQTNTYRAGIGAGASGALKLYAGATGIMGNPNANSNVMRLLGFGGSLGATEHDVTWNNAAAVNPAFLLSITDTASPGSAKLMTTNLGASTFFEVRRTAGAPIVTNGPTSNTRACLGAEAGIYSPGALSVYYGDRQYPGFMASYSHDFNYGGPGLQLSAANTIISTSTWATVGIRGCAAEPVDVATLVFCTSIAQSTSGGSAIERMQITGAGNIGLFNPANQTNLYYGGGLSTLYVANTATAPSTNPTGGIFAFATGGALMVRGQSGEQVLMGAATGGNVQVQTTWNNTAGVDPALKVVVKNVASTPNQFPVAFRVQDSAGNIAFEAGMHNSGAFNRFSNGSLTESRVESPIAGFGKAGLGAYLANEQVASLAFVTQWAIGGYGEGPGIYFKSPGDATACNFSAIGQRKNAGNEKGTLAFYTSPKDGVNSPYYVYERMQITATGNIGLFNPVSGATLGAPIYYGEGIGTLYVGNCASMPATNPTGGVFIFATGGGLVARGAGGTLTVIAAP